MKPSQARAIAAPALIALVCCIGAPLVVVSPIRARLEAARVELDAAIRDAGGAGDHGSAMVVVDMRRRADAIEALNAVSGDAAGLYERMMSLTRESGVRVRRLQPARGSTVPSAASAGVDSMGYTITAEGEYARLAGLIDSIDHRAGFSAVLSFRLTSALSEDDPSLIEGTIDTVHRRFGLPVSSPVARAGAGAQQ